MSQLVGELDEFILNVISLTHLTGNHIYAHVCTHTHKREITTRKIKDFYMENKTLKTNPQKNYKTHIKKIHHESESSVQQTIGLIPAPKVEYLANIVHTHSHMHTHLKL